MYNMMGKSYKFTNVCLAARVLIKRFIISPPTERGLYIFYEKVTVLMYAYVPGS